MMGPARSGVAVLALILAGCAARGDRPAAIPAPAPGAQESASHTRMTADLEQTLLTRARAFHGERRWADAVVQWELLTVLRPQSREHQAGLEAARAAAREAASAHLKEADSAKARRNVDQAVLGYLRALAADPSSQTAATALKSLEADKVGKAWLNRPPRFPYTPPGQSPVAAPNTEEPAPRR